MAPSIIKMLEEAVPHNGVSSAKRTRWCACTCSGWRNNRALLSRVCQTPPEEAKPPILLQSRADAIENNDTLWGVVRHTRASLTLPPLMLAIDASADLCTTPRDQQITGEAKFSPAMYLAQLNQRTGALGKSTATELKADKRELAPKYMLSLCMLHMSRQHAIQKNAWLKKKASLRCSELMASAISCTVKFLADPLHSASAAHEYGKLSENADCRRLQSP